jgi:16S rRNA (guanine527-N7)-methyltransferase
VSRQSFRLLDLAANAAPLGVALSAEQLGQFDVLASELVSWNQRVNLTAIGGREMNVKNFLDSLTVLPLIAPSVERGPAKLIDVGAGAGMPGLPLAIADPRLHVTLLESVTKKVAFLQHAIDILGLSNATALHGRAEHLAHSADHRQRYELATARAVASAATLVELLVPFLMVGGLAVLMKTPGPLDEELPRAERALLQLGAHVEGVVPVALSGSAGELLGPRVLIVVRKDCPTDERYPRRPGTPQKRPLGTMK